MKKALCLALILLITGPVMFVAGGLWVDSEKDNVVITTATLYGDSEVAAGIRLHMVSQWQDQLIWVTEYAVGSGETVSQFTFSSWGEDWPRKAADEITVDCITDWGTVIENTRYNGMTIDPEQTRIVSSLESGIELVDMAPNENQDRLFLVTKEENEYYLNVYETDKDSLVLSQKISVRPDLAEGEDGYEPWWAQLSVQENGVLLVWQDGSFVFVALMGNEMDVWEPEQFPSIQNFVFPGENVWSFDGQRLALASYADWSSTSVNMAVYTKAGMAWYGICEAWYDVGEHSGDFGDEQEISTFRISPPGSVIGNRGYRPRDIPVEKILGIWWDQ